MHPVPLRVTPDSQSLPACMAEEEALRSPRRLAEPAENVVNDQTSPKRAVAQPSLESGDIRPIQRPQPKKPAGMFMNLNPPIKIYFISYLIFMVTKFMFCFCYSPW